MEIIFRDKYVNYNQISDVSLMTIHDILMDNDIDIGIGDNFANDWAGYSYCYCKSLNELDDITIASFVYVISWFMTGDAIDINDSFKSDYYYKNNMIVIACLDILDDVISEFDSEIDICKEFFKRVYSFYLSNHRNYIKLTERVNCLISYKELELLDNIDGDNRSEKIRILLDNYYNLSS